MKMTDWTVIPSYPDYEIRVAPANAHIEVRARSTQRPLDLHENATGGVYFGLTVDGLRVNRSPRRLARDTWPHLT